MASPMGYIGPDEFMCAQCFSMTPVDEATFDMYHHEEKVLVNICIPCRMAETYWMIRKNAAYPSPQS